MTALAHRREKDERGFTLIEILLAMVMMTVVALAVAHVVGLTSRAQKSVRVRGEHRALLSAVERRIDADLRAVIPPGGLYAAGLIGADATGVSGEQLIDPERIRQALSAAGFDDPPPFDQRDTLTLAVFPPAAAFGSETPAGEGAIWEVVYGIDDDPETDARGLIRTVTRIREQPAGVEPPAPEELCPEVVAMDLAFFDGETWAETWDSGASDTLPMAVEMTLVFDHGDELVSYKVMVAPSTGRPSALMEAAE
jgi:prepilin-type N-terminal cleavage/methylation domain-containing protein